MKTNVKLVAGSIAGLLSAVAVVAALLWATADAGSSDSVSAEPAVERDLVEPVPTPQLDNELATTHRSVDTSTRSPEPMPEPVLEEDPYEPELDASGPIRVRRLIISTGVSDHEPTGAEDVFELGAQRRIYAFVDAVNETDEEVALRVTFEPEEGDSTGHVSLEIPENRSRFRTWAWTRHIYSQGRWNVVVRAPDGHVVARRAFEVIDL